MSILTETNELPIIMVGHVFDVNNRAYRDGFTNFYDDRNRCYRPDWTKLNGLLGFRQTHQAYVRALERYIVAAFMTCYVDETGVHVHDNRFNKIIRMVNALYGLPMGTLEVEFNLNPGVLRIWSKHQGFAWSGILNFNLTKPDIYRGIGWKNEADWSNQKFNTLERGYYYVKPQAIKTHMMYIERLLNYDVDNNILR